MTTSNVDLYAGRHAIEAEDFAIVFRAPLDNGDEGRFQESLEEIGGYFAAVDEPNVLQLFWGANPEVKSGSAKPVLKTLMEFARDGSPAWSGQFGENAVAVTCNKYGGWAETWPQVRARLEILLKCVDQFKLVSSIEYGVTDTLRESVSNGHEQLLAANIFKRGSWVPDRLLDEYRDARWDFSGGAFVSRADDHELLERVEAKGYISGEHKVVSVKNSFSVRFVRPTRLKEILSDGSFSGLIENFFIQLHDKNKDTIRSLLVDTLLERMGL